MSQYEDVPCIVISIMMMILMMPDSLIDNPNFNTISFELVRAMLLANLCRLLACTRLKMRTLGSSQICVFLNEDGALAKMRAFSAILNVCKITIIIDCRSETTLANFLPPIMKICLLIYIIRVFQVFAESCPCS